MNLLHPTPSGHARVAFIQKSAYEKISTHYLAGALKTNAIDCDVFVDDLEDNFYDAVAGYHPDFIVFSLFIGEESFAFHALGELKKRLPGVTTLVGGPFTLIFPDIYKRDEIDYVFRGDGEFTLPEFILKKTASQDVSTVNGICYAVPGHRPVVNIDNGLVDIQHIPRPDRRLYYKYPRLAENPTKMVIASRGCPYKCTYCYNVELSKCFSSSYWRLRNIDDIIDEIRQLQKNTRVKWIYFPDGTFTASRKWLMSFLNKYKENDLPGFICNARVENIDEEIVQLLKSAGCDRVTFGIQSGNEYVRKHLSGRNMSNRQIVRACRLCKKYGIRVGADIIFGWPGETRQQAMDTIRLCRTIDVETYSSNVLIFYPGLRITEFAAEKGAIKSIPTLEAIQNLTPNQSLLVQSNKNMLINMDKLFYYLIKFPKYEKLLLFLLRFPPNRLYFLLKNMHILIRSFKYDEHRPKASIIKEYIKSH